MKNYLFLPVLITGLVFSSFNLKKGGSKVEWRDIEEAQELSKTTPKKIFIDFTAKWCGWCKVMDKKTFTDPEVIEYLNENYYSVKLNFDSPAKFEYLGEFYTAKELAKMNGITGLPTMLVASADFKEVEQIVGYQKPKQFINKLKALDE